MSTTTIEASSTIAAIETTETTEQRVIQHARRPIPFDTFIELSQGKDLELIDGVMVRRMSVQLEHEKLFNWLYRLAGDYVEERGLGILFGSRTAVEISEFKGRLPDLLFVRAERMNIVRQKAIYGAPDLVIELVSPGDRPSDIIALETDYRAVAVPEIWFVDEQKRRARVLRKREKGYEEQELTAGRLRSEQMEGFEVEVAWLFDEPRPTVRQTLAALLGQQPV